MKKLSMILALLLAFAMAFVLIGCPKTDKPEEPTDEPYGGVTTEAFDIKIEKNQYSNAAASSKGNQAKLSFADINTKLGKSFKAPKEGDKYTVEITFTPDKDGDKDAKGVAFSLALVDTNKNADGTNTYWLVRGEWSDPTGGEVGEDAGYLNVAEIKASTAVTLKGTLTATAPSTESGAEVGEVGDFCLVFAMEAQPWANEVTINVTSFAFYKLP